MKKFITICVAFTMFSACNVNTEPVQFTATTIIDESISVSVPQTSGVSVAFNESLNGDLNAIITNYSQITDININELSYQFENVFGNTNAVIESGSLTINGVTIASLSNVNISQSASAATVFEISDPAVLNQLEDLFLDNSAVSIQFSGTLISDEGSIDFDVALSINLSITI